jgi:acetaldehyde dehydrogenase
MAGIIESEGIPARGVHGYFRFDGRGTRRMRDPEIRSLICDATSATGLQENAPLLRAAGIRSIDLTPLRSALTACVVNLDLLREEPDINMVTCGGRRRFPSSTP